MSDAYAARGVERLARGRLQVRPCVETQTQYPGRRLLAFFRRYKTSFQNPGTHPPLPSPRKEQRMACYSELGV